MEASQLLICGMDKHIFEKPGSLSSGTETPESAVSIPFPSPEMSFPRTIRFPFLDFSMLSSKYLHLISEMARMVFELSTIYILHGSNQLPPRLSAPPITSQLQAHQHSYSDPSMAMGISD
ncbi:hypothetical protein I7I51_02554 [Histoplasma capsulatum]|uniref:Uncharacterized protein n=1 Tax=Ajellomyces capsulatus TaxID=5037 RepID=A0A8A1ME82_AJECA|nr:hypothetical protein I7I51_02554 [Histoplasma capsulatum]